ncbi:MAG: hypothetical protein E3J72_02085 [Planctomycetota bacterium]|nr:MAG: hypothetical protein E3J72_02085 [Planctomycetota bacterium]
MLVMRTAVIVSLFAGFSLLSGCGYIIGIKYSEQRMGMQVSIPETVEDAYGILGKPDIHYRFGDNQILGWRRIEAFSVYARFFLVAWSRYKCFSVGIVADRNGKVVSCGRVPSGSGYTVLSTGTAPVEIRYGTGAGSR